MADYNELWARKDPIGGDVTEVTEHSGQHLNGKSEVIILIHGYNNDVQKARDSYRTFIEHIENDFPRFLASGNDARSRAIFKFFWPGETSAGETISSLFYAKMVKRTPGIADKFEKYLNDKSGPGGSPLQIHIIAHSLGCRITLELINYLLTRPQAGNHRVASFTLMAAAVPENMVEGALLRAAQAVDKKTSVLHSQKDQTLHWGFPAGQTAAGEGTFPVAVGRWGRPTIWSSSKNMSRLNYGHGDYWPGVESANEVVRFLNGTVSNINEESIAEHALQPTRVVAARNLTVRTTTNRIIG